jgi:acyl-coenzyme A thioesterase PaaI-like protein
VAADLARELTPQPDDGRWTFDLSKAWDFLLPSGGVLASASLRAAEAELDEPALRLVSSSTIFCTPIAPGRLDAEVTILRRGGNAAQVRIALRNAEAGEPGLETLATFARARPGPDVLGARFPDVPLPADCADLVDDAAPNNPHKRAPFFGNFEARLASGSRFWIPGWQGGAARYARWFRYLVSPRGIDNKIARFAFPPIIDTMPPALFQALGPSPYRFYAPSLDLTCHIVDDTERDWLLVSAFARRAAGGTAIAEVEVWDDTRRLVAYGTQTMYLRTITGDPPQGIVAP